MNQEPENVPSRTIGLESKLTTSDRSTKQVKDGQMLNTKSRKIKVNQEDLDLSYVLDTHSEQTGMCPHCYKELEMTKLKRHIDQLCMERIVSCTETGCGISLPQRDLKKHLAIDCLMTKKRRELALQAVIRKEQEQQERREAVAAAKTAMKTMDNQSMTLKPLLPGTVTPSKTAVGDVTESPILGLTDPVPPHSVVCERCSERVRDIRLKEHQLHECKMRLVLCPNRFLGCEVEVPLVQLQSHLKSDCVVEKKKDEYTAKSHLRREPVICVGCGSAVPLMYLRKHERESCVNRLVPCRNCNIGCAVMVRLKDRHLHEHVDGSLIVRSCLYLDGGTAHIHLGENDIPPSWTIEFWLYRPSEQESAKQHIRTALRLHQVFLEKAKAEEEVKLKVDEEQKVFVDALRRLDSAERSLNSAETRESAAKPLSNLITEYERAALATMTSALQLTNSIDAAMSLLEVLVEIDTTQQHYLVANPPGTHIAHAALESDLVASEESAETDIVDDGGEDVEAPQSSAALDNDETAADQQVDAEGIRLERDENANVGNNRFVEDLSPTSGVSMVSLGDGGDLEQTQEVAKDEGDGVEERSRQDSTVNMRDIELEFKSRHLKYWSEWRDEIVKIKAETEEIVEKLHSHREESGLIRQSSTDSKKKHRKKSESVDSADTDKESQPRDKEKERKARKRAKDKLRREANKMKRKQSLGQSSKFHEEIKWLHRTCVGVDVIASTGEGFGATAGRICLDMGSLDGEKSRGKFGYASAEFEPVYFETVKIPRQQWTHIALVCMGRPKKRMTLYVDGVGMGVKKDYVMKLPMASIGGLEHSFQGCLLDCRYWAKPRSAVQIVKEDMHRLISFSSTTNASDKKTKPGVSLVKHLIGKRRKSPDVLDSDGLVGWWPFEDGPKGKRVTDVSGHRFKALIVQHPHSIYKWLSADAVSMATMSRSGGNIEPPPLPVPSYRERNLCPFEIRRFKLAQRGRALLQEADCPLGCESPLRRIDIRFHVRFECERRRVPCRFPFCHSLFPSCDRERHEAKDCVIAVSREFILDKAVEANRLLPCSLCSEEIRNRDLEAHQTQECPYRMLRCPEPGCGEDIEAHNFKYHQRYKCLGTNMIRRRWLIERARKRHPYTRPWGIEVKLDDFDDSDSDDDEEYE